jgi:hypothetical protein
MIQVDTVVKHVGEEPSEIPGISEAPTEDQKLIAECSRVHIGFVERSDFYDAADAPQLCQARAVPAAANLAYATNINTVSWSGPRGAGLQPICDCPNFWE